MKIRSLRLQDFRCFEDLSIQFDPQLTVLVGANGSGKTSVLDALSVFTQAFMERQMHGENNYPGIHLKTTDSSLLKNVDQIQITLTMFENNELFCLFSKDADNIGKLHDPNQYNKTFQIFNEIFKGIAIYGIEIFTLYGAQRCLPENYNNEHISGTPRENIFIDAFSANINFKASSEWFIKRSADEAIQAKKLNDFAYKIPEVQAVEDALLDALNNNYDDVQAEVTTSTIKLRHKNTQNYYEINQLSDGYKTMLALVMDLARRMAVANGEMYAKSGKSPLASPAVVLIDEVELHLHPSWQQTVLPSLTSIFPNTQFIVTTHSPQVISSIEPKHIRILRDGRVLPVETSTYGAECSRVLEEVFGVPVRPLNEVKRALDRYLHLINDGEGQGDEGRDLRAKLDEWLAEDPVLDRADMFIARNARRKEREGRSRA